MRAEIITVGTELLLGQIVDTNSSWIAERLAEIGVDVYFQTKVGDNHERMVKVFHLALERADVLIITGGLGPTQDDITREAIAEVTGRPLQRNPEIATRIEALFSALGREMGSLNLRQADVPTGATWIPMTRGTAPGLIVPHNGKVIYAVPGVPREMEDMLQRAVLPDIVSRMGEGEDKGGQLTIMSRVLKCWGLPESRLAELMSPRFEALANEKRVTMAFLAGSGVIRVRLTAKGESKEIVSTLLDTEERECRKILGDVVFGVGDDTMESVCVDLLRELGLRIGVAESLTGGMVGEWLTRVSGSSEVFVGSVVAYSGEAKENVLKVPRESLEKYGPVSEQTARAMATGVRELYNTEIGISTTGLAGPTGERAEAEESENREDETKPEIGRVFIGIDFSGESDVRTFRFPGAREQVRTIATASVLDMLRHCLLGYREQVGSNS